MSMESAVIATKAETVSKRQAPWAMIGKDTGDAMTAAEAIKAGELDWTVAPKSLFVGIGDKKVRIPERRAIVRSSDDKVLGITSDRYVPFQNEEAFTFVDNLVDSGEAKYTVVGSYRGGKVVFLVAKLPDEVLIGGEDAHNLYLLLRTSHDGSKAVSVNVTPVRVRCTNAVEMAARGAKHKWVVHHTTRLQERIAEARGTIQLAHKYAGAFQAEAERLIAQQVTDDQFHDIIADLLPERPKTEEVIDSIMHIWQESPTNGYHGTGWGALNAVSEYFEHGRETRSGEAVFASVIDGQAAHLRDRLNQRVLALA